LDEAQYSRKVKVEVGKYLVGRAVYFELFL
jgi:hypothetical protein